MDEAVGLSHLLSALQVAGLAVLQHEIPDASCRGEFPLPALHRSPSTQAALHHSRVQFSFQTSFKSTYFSVGLFEHK